MAAKLHVDDCGADLRARDELESFFDRGCREDACTSLMATP
jgi:hypothetical protein